MFDWEHGIVLHPMQGNRASSLGEGEVFFFFFLEFHMGPGVYSPVSAGVDIKNFCLFSDVRTV